MVARSLTEPPSVVLYADGGTLGGSPGRGIYWSVGSKKRGVLRYRDDKRKFSDEAEMLALLSALDMLSGLSKEGDVALILMDSRPTVRHIQTGRKPRAARLRELYWKVCEALESLKGRGVTVSLQWRRRSDLVKELGH